MKKQYDHMFYERDDYTEFADTSGCYRLAIAIALAIIVSSLLVWVGYKEYVL